MQDLLKSMSFSHSWPTIAFKRHHTDLAEKHIFLHPLSLQELQPRFNHPIDNFAHFELHYISHQGVLETSQTQNLKTRAGAVCTLYNLVSHDIIPVAQYQEDELGLNDITMQ
jgi:hypothetical protein